MLYVCSNWRPSYHADGSLFFLPAVCWTVEAICARGGELCGEHVVVFQPEWERWISLGSVCSHWWPLSGFPYHSSGALCPPFVAKSQLRGQLSVATDSIISDSTSPRSAPPPLLVCKHLYIYNLFFNFSLLQLMVDSYRSDVSYLVSPRNRYAILRASLELALQLAELYEKLPSFVDVFDPLSTHIERSVL